MNKDMKKWEEQDGAKFLRGIRLQLNQRVLDFGCRVGHYTIPAAKVVGNKGIVYAVDKEQEALDELQQKAAHLNLKNIKIINASGRMRLPLESRTIDAILFYDVLHYHKREERKKLYAEAYRVLKQDGFLSVYPKHTLEDDPIREFKEMSISDVKQEIEDSKFVFEKKHCGLISHDDGLNQGCILNFRKSQGEK